MWWDDAACADHPNPELWFPELARRPAEALQTCYACPVIEPCLRAAVNTRSEDDHGIWGGTTPSQRRALRLRLPRPRA